MTRLYAPAADLFQRVVDKRVVRTATGCWEFQGTVISSGYGCTAAGRKGKSVLVHRLAVIVRDGEIPDGMEVDHLCRNRICCNPDHLEVVTAAENNRRGRVARGYVIGGRCGNGHELTEENVHRRRGRLACRTCDRGHRAEHAARTAWAEGKVPAALIRRWATSVGMDVPATGRLPHAARDAYMAAHYGLGRVA